MQTQRVKAWFYVFLNSTLEGTWTALSPGCFTRGKGHWYPLDKKWDDPHTQMGHHVEDKPSGPARN